jgi:predicted ATP-grasp superfamily ATP-dependent carboligase
VKNEKDGPMRRVFVYEYLSGGGTLDDDPQAAAELLPLGAAMRDAMVLDLLCSGDCAVTMATCPQSAGLPGATPVMPRDGEPPHDFVARQAARHDAVWLVAPETGGLLAQLAACVGPARWLGCTPAAIRLASSKRATVEHLAARGVPTPLAFADDASVQRWVVKPDDGAGAQDTRLHADHDSACRDRDARRGTPAWLEPWIDGEALSLSMLCHAGRAELLSVNRQHIAIGPDGTLRYAGVSVNVIAADDVRRGTLAALVSDVARALPGLRGFVGIDLVWQAQRGPVLIEINPRVTCAYVGLSASLGRNVAAALLAALGTEAVHA